jgi:hypothetical protein
VARFTQRQATWVGILGFLLVVLVSPLSAIWAFDYQLVPTTVPPGLGVRAVAYSQLDPAVQAAVDAAMAGDGPWYRTPYDSPLPRNPLVVVKDGRLLAFELDDRFHWESWRGKVPAVTVVSGALIVAYVIYDRM